MNLLENMREMGYSEEQIRQTGLNPHLSEFVKIIDAANSFEEILEKIKEVNPDFDEAEFKKLCESQDALPEKKTDSDCEEMVDLEDDALEAVAGGSIGSWFKKNWKTVVGAVVAGPAGAVVGDLLSTSQKKQTPVAAAVSREDEAAVRGEETNNGLVLG